MATLLISNEFGKMPVLFSCERDISCYNFQVITRKKPILLYEKILDIKRIGNNITTHQSCTKNRLN